ncbi:hypothetical protein [Methanofollis fontis]|uniref:Uncharacterized protein n=1 Tax=Methanofollis fontis TaxID=2052832 RepID=A0A483CW49_9EURY|nr:hypothetical protein [Methanofollis fontis]TAJ45390.1 hypothetical protein CUJ86_01200 [Methanofollis fontis]
MTRRSITDDEGVSNLLQYVYISGVLIVLLVITMFAVNAAFMEGPANKLKYHAYVDIGNGLSTRIVDVYMIAPDNGTIATEFDIPDDVAEQDYMVELDGSGGDQVVAIYRDDIRSSISIAGIGVTMGVTGNTTSGGINRIVYNSSGV